MAKLHAAWTERLNAEGLTVSEVGHDGKQALLQAEAITTTRSLWEMLTG